MGSNEELRVWEKSVGFPCHTLSPSFWCFTEAAFLALSPLQRLTFATSH